MKKILQYTFLVLLSLVSWLTATFAVNKMKMNYIRQQNVLDPNGRTYDVCVNEHTCYPGTIGYKTDGFCIKMFRGEDGSQIDYACGDIEIQYQYGDDCNCGSFND